MHLTAIKVRISGNPIAPKLTKPVHWSSAVFFRPKVKTPLCPSTVGILSAWEHTTSRFKRGSCCRSRGPWTIDIITEQPMTTCHVPTRAVWFLLVAHRVGIFAVTYTASSYRFLRGPQLRRMSTYKWITEMLDRCICIFGTLLQSKSSGAGVHSQRISPSSSDCCTQSSADQYDGHVSDQYQYSAFDGSLFCRYLGVLRWNSKAVKLMVGTLILSVNCHQLWTIGAVRECTKMNLAPLPMAQSFIVDVTYFLNPLFIVKQWLSRNQFTYSQFTKPGWIRMINPQCTSIPIQIRANSRCNLLSHPISFESDQ